MYKIKNKKRLLVSSTTHIFPFPLSVVSMFMFVSLPLYKHIVFACQTTSTTTLSSVNSTDAFYKLMGLDWTTGRWNKLGLNVTLAGNDHISPYQPCTFEIDELPFFFARNGICIKVPLEGRSFLGGLSHETPQVNSFSCFFGGEIRYYVWLGCFHSFPPKWRSSTVAICSQRWVFLIHVHFPLIALWEKWNTQVNLR